MLDALKPITHRRRRRDGDSTVELRRIGVGGVTCVHEFATSSRRLPTDSVHNLETDQTDSILREI